MEAFFRVFFWNQNNHWLINIQNHDQILMRIDHAVWATAALGPEVNQPVPRPTYFKINLWVQFDFIYGSSKSLLQEIFFALEILSIT